LVVLVGEAQSIPIELQLMKWEIVREIRNLQQPDSHAYWCKKCQSHCRFFHEEKEKRASELSALGPWIYAAILVCDECNEKVFMPSEAKSSFIKKTVLTLFVILLGSIVILGLFSPFLGLIRSVIALLFLSIWPGMFLFHCYHKEYGAWKNWASKRARES